MARAVARAVTSAEGVRDTAYCVVASRVRVRAHTLRYDC